MDSPKNYWQAPAMQELAIRQTAAHAQGRFVDTIYGEWSLRECTEPAPALPDTSGGSAVRVTGREVWQVPAGRAWQAPDVRQFPVLTA